MKRRPCLLIHSSLLCGQSFSAAPAASLPIQLILIGDSTMATRSGYADALYARFKPGTRCVNLAHGGHSSASCRSEGRQDEVQSLLSDSAACRASYVPVQFGHNDQSGKPGRSTGLVTAFPANMVRYARDVKQLGGVLVLVTPLTRRSFASAGVEAGQ